jgi:sulfite exporter TauE/SafE
MAETPASDRLSARFLDYFGLGCILTGVDVAVKDSAYMTGVTLIIIGGVILYIGLNWEKKLQARVNESVRHSLDSVTHDVRWMLIAFLGLLFIARGPVFIRTLSVPYSRTA